VICKLSEIYLKQNFNTAGTSTSIFVFLYLVFGFYLNVVVTSSGFIRWKKRQDDTLSLGCNITFAPYHIVTYTNSDLSKRAALSVVSSHFIILKSQKFGLYNFFKFWLCHLRSKEVTRVYDHGTKIVLPFYLEYPRVGTWTGPTGMKEGSRRYVPFAGITFCANLWMPSHISSVIG